MSRLVRSAAVPVGRTTRCRTLDQLQVTPHVVRQAIAVVAGATSTSVGMQPRKAAGLVNTAGDSRSSAFGRAIARAGGAETPAAAGRTRPLKPSQWRARYVCISAAARMAAVGCLALIAVAAAAIELQPDVVVTATRAPEHSFDLPASIDRVDGRAIRDGQLAVNLSESLAAVAGLSAQNRQNYAQDLQLSVRGFGARSSFGVRGVRLYADGIPGTMPDGQGQFSHFDLGSADHIEVLRGPFSALYGNSSGGVISIFTAAGHPGGNVEATAADGSLGTRRYALRAGGESDVLNYVASAAHFETDGYRQHSRAERNGANMKLRLALDPVTSLTLVANAIETPAVHDPLGLTRSQVAADPRQAGTNAGLYNTRKNLSQEQVGAMLERQLTNADRVTLAVYDGRRRTNQFLAILAAVEANPLHPGGVVELGRDYRGADVHLLDQRAPGGTLLSITAGLCYESLAEARRGFLNFAGAQLGVEGALRRDEDNHVHSADEYAQLQWDPSARWQVLAGVRHGQVEVASRDRLAPAAPVSRVSYSATNPVAGVRLQIVRGVNGYASYGRGFETPTLNDLAYRSTTGTLPGLNGDLRPAQSDNYELGVKAQADGYRLDAAAFYIRTRHELAVQSNSGGRSVFENIDATERRGAEVGLDASWDDGLDARLAYTWIRAVNWMPYNSCAGLPCLRVVVPADSRLPAVPQHTLYASLSWRAPQSGFSTTVETVGRSQIYVDDRNTDSASGYWAINWRAGFTQTTARWVLTESLRIDNLADRRYVGTVIVNESTGRYFEPASGRTVYLLLRALHH